MKISEENDIYTYFFSEYGQKYGKIMRKLYNIMTLTV